MSETSIGCKVILKAMRRYWLFASVDYYASGGMCDFIGSFDSQVDAAAFGEHLIGTEDVEWWHVFDAVEGRISGESEGKPYGFQEYPRFDA